MNREPESYSTPPSEGLAMAAFAVVCGIVMMVFAVIGIWTVIGWIF